MLPNELKDRLVDVLMLVPGTEKFDRRTALLNGIPSGVRGVIARDDSAFIDLTNSIQYLDGLGRLENGERPVVIVAHNAHRMTRGTELGKELAAIEQAIEDAYGGDLLRSDVPTVPEALVFGGVGEWVSETFFEQARLAGTRVARLRVPRFEGEALRDSAGSLGTGWLVAPDLLLTNYHVVAARKLYGGDGCLPEPPPTEADFKLQSQGTVAWFDYHVEGKQPPDIRVVGAVCKNRELDYALLRLEQAAELKGRRHMALTREKPAFVRGLRLNIVQCPGGGPLRYAIRNNFCVGVGKKLSQVQYLTDTQKGSSGAPVLDDSWQVVALHYGAAPVDPGLYQGDAGFSGVVKYHNVGTAIHAILDDLSPPTYEEVKAAQGWT